MKLVQQQPGGENIKAFTRIMHRTTDDDLVGEVSEAQGGRDTHNLGLVRALAAPTQQ